MSSDISDCRIQYAVSENVVFLKLAGHVSYMAHSGFDFFVDRLVSQHKICDVLVDLDDVTYIDSTNLGILAMLAGGIMKNCGVKPKLMSSNPDITGNIEIMGLDRVYHCVKDDYSHIPEVLIDIPHVDMDHLGQAKQILSAHKELMNLSEKNREVFRNVVDFLEKDVNENSGDDQLSLF